MPVLRGISHRWRNISTNLVFLVQTNVVIAIRGEGLVDGDGDDDEEDQAGGAERRTTYALHPNCGLFDDE